MDNQQGKKQLPLRLSAKLYAELAAWAEDEFRSVNGQLQWLIADALRRSGRLKKPKKTKQDDTPAQP